MTIDTMTEYASNADDSGYSASVYIMHAYCVAYWPPTNPIAMSDRCMSLFTPNGWRDSFVVDTDHVG